MSSLLERRKATQRRAIKKQRRRLKRFRAIRANVLRARANIAKRRRLIRAAENPGAAVMRWALDRVGKTENPPGSNDAPFLGAWRKRLKTLDWMKGQPWCGFFCIAAWEYAAGKRLPDGVVYTPNIVAWAKAGTNGFKAVPASKARPGDLVVFNFPGGSTIADHVGLALGPAKGGSIQTVEGNTSPSNSGSQANGGGVFQRTRPVGLIAVVARPT